MANWKLIVGVVLVLLGLFYVVVPHSIHQATIGLNLTHPVHIVLGIVLLIIGGFLIWKR